AIITTLLYGQYAASPNEVYFFARLIFVMTGAGVFLLLLLPSVYRIVSPGLAICSLLWMLILVFGSYGMFPDMPRAKLVGTVLLLGYLAASNGYPYKMKIPGLEWRYRPSAQPPWNRPGDESEPSTAAADPVAMRSNASDLRLMCWGDGTGVPTSGDNLVI